MRQSNSFSLAHVIAAAWQQRRNAGSPWGFVVVVALCFAAPVALSIWSLVADPSAADSLRGNAKASAGVGVVALLIACWAMLVGNVLRQNHPTLARLVPRHVSRLREALLVVWALLVLLAAGVPGFAFDAPLAWACGTAACLVALAAALRWPVLWLGGFAIPFSLNWFLGWRGHDAVLAGWRARWQSEGWLVAAIVVAAGAAVLTRMIRTGGTIHGASYDAGRRLGQAFGRSCGDGSPATLPGYPGRLGAAVARPYAAWMRHLLARGDSPVMSRLLVGLGPAAHWTTRIYEAFWSIVVSVAICTLVGSVVGHGMLAYILPWLGFSMLTTVCTPSLQAVPRLHRTPREQALLVLLPGVPRGGRLNRWLAWQLSATFVVSALCGLALAWALAAYADSILPGVVEHTAGGMVPALAAAVLPQVAWQCRCWARLRGESSSGQSLSTFAPFLLGAAILALHWAMDIGYVTSGVVATLGSLAWCAWRWQRMGGEPTALPVGRLSN